MAKPLRPEIITLLVAAFIASALNLPFWSRFFHEVQPARIGDWLFVGSVAIVVVLLLNLALLLFSLKPVFRALIAILLPVTAAAAYFMQEYGVILDVNMARNVFETDAREAGDLLTAAAASFVLLLGVAPAALVWRLRWLKRPFAEDLKAKLKAAAVSAIIVAIAVFPFWGEYLSLFRQAKELRHTLAPLNAIVATAGYLKQRVHAAPAALAETAPDAKRLDEPEARPHVFVIVVGETARADHFGLNGYERQTTPELAKIAGLVSYENVSSCGTDTAQSVPCMFSDLGRKKFSVEAAASRENLLDVLHRSKADVLWRENQSGCKGVCSRVPTEVLTRRAITGDAAPNEGYDEVLLDGLEERLRQASRDTVIVLHMMGSHGPAYAKRYPASFEKFTPVCRESQFSRCAISDIINAYDNTILYTDHVLARLIAILSGEAARGVDAGMLYVSDHGESLGEHNIYLHGMPYAIAPEAQTHVPMIVWLSKGLLDDNAIEIGCLRKRAAEPLSHDNLFHTVIGIMDIETSNYDPQRDVFAKCSRGVSAHATR